MKFKALFYILASVALILWSVTGKEFMQDELSALSRLDYGSLRALFNEGVRPDGHPAFVQLFLYFWTRIFGYSEWIVKLPSMVCGISSMWLAYKLSRKLFDSYVGLMVVAIIAISQYYVLYFSIARPYAFGTFFVLGQVYSLVQWRENKGKSHRWMFLLFTVLSAYTHYFSMMVAGLVTLWGFLWLKPSQFKTYLLTIVLCILAFLPHLQLSLDQLSKGGLGGTEGWLGALEPDFAWNYFSYLGQYHIAGLCLFSLAAITTFIRLPRMNTDQARFILLGFGLMLIPLFIGYQYSIRVNPVLQFSVLIFGSIPFLISMFSGFKFLGTRSKTFILILTICISVYGLLSERAHHEIMEFQPYAELADSAENSQDEILLMADMHKNFIAQYEKSRTLNYTYVQLEGRSLQEIKQRMVGNGPVLLHVDRMAEILPMAWDEYGPDACWITRPCYDLLRLRSELPQGRCSTVMESMNGPLLNRKKGEAYGEAFQMVLSEVKGFPYITLIVDQEIDSLDGKEGTLVSEIWQGDSLVHWLGRDLEEYSVQSDTGLRTYLSIRIQDAVKEELYTEELLWKTYFWNRSGMPIHGDSLHIRIIQDSATRYGLFQEF